MKKSIEISTKARVNIGGHTHLTHTEHRRAWKSNRRIVKRQIQEIVDEIDGDQEKPK